MISNPPTRKQLTVIQWLAIAINVGVLLHNCYLLWEGEISPWFLVPAMVIQAAVIGVLIWAWRGVHRRWEKQDRESLL